MATARKVQLIPENSGVFNLNKPSVESAEMASRLLQQNHEVNEPYLVLAQIRQECLTHDFRNMYVIIVTDDYNL